MKFIQYAIVAIALAVELLEASPAPKVCIGSCKRRRNREKKAADIKKAHAYQCGEIANLADFAEKGSKLVGGFKDETSCKASTCGKYGGGCAAFGEKEFLCHNSRAELIESCAVQGVANS
jgi:hypothetical protein